MLARGALSEVVRFGACGKFLTATLPGGPGGSVSLVTVAS